MGLRLPIGLTYKRGGGGQSKSRLSHGQLPGQLRLSGKIFGWIGQPETPYFEHCNHVDLLHFKIYFEDNILINFNSIIVLNTHYVHYYYESTFFGYISAK